MPQSDAPLHQALASPQGERSRRWVEAPPLPLVWCTLPSPSAVTPSAGKLWNTSHKLLPESGLLANRRGLSGLRTGAYGTGNHWSRRIIQTGTRSKVLVRQSRCLAPETPLRLKAGRPGSLAARPAALSAVLVLNLIVTQAGYLQVIWDCEIGFLKARVKQVALGDQTP